MEVPPLLKTLERDNKYTIDALVRRSVAFNIMPHTPANTEQMRVVMNATNINLVADWCGLHNENVTEYFNEPNMIGTLMSLARNTEYFQCSVTMIQNNRFLANHQVMSMYWLGIYMHWLMAAALQMYEAVIDVDTTSFKKLEPLVSSLIKLVYPVSSSGITYLQEQGLITSFTFWAVSSTSIHRGHFGENFNDNGPTYKVYSLTLVACNFDGVIQAGATILKQLAHLTKISEPLPGFITLQIHSNALSMNTPGNWLPLWEFLLIYINILCNKYKYQCMGIFSLQESPYICIVWNFQKKYGNPPYGDLSCLRNWRVCYSNQDDQYSLDWSGVEAPAVCLCNMLDQMFEDKRQHPTIHDPIGKWHYKDLIKPLYYYDNDI